MISNGIFGSESVSEGHPDKIADAISDAILDSMIAEDPNCRSACETLVKTGMVLVAGEVSTSHWVDIEALVREVVCEIGYNCESLGFDGNTCAVLNAIGKQSADIAMGVDRGNDEEQGAGDQGIMFGYACDETDVYMPAPIHYAHALVKRQAYCRKEKILPWLGPDAKSQLMFRYNNGAPVAIESVVLSTQHTSEISLHDLREAVIETIITPTLPANLVSETTKFYINPTGNFIIGGPVADCGLTGRKIIVDTYGGMAHHGGGCFSGKDPSKVDRSAAYMARYMAKNVIAAGLAKRCEIQLTYAIGVAHPISIYVETYGTGIISNLMLAKALEEVFDCSPYGMIKTMDLLRPIYRQTAAYGHFGRKDIDLPWEKTDKAEQVLNAAKRYSDE